MTSGLEGAAVALGVLVASAAAGLGRTRVPRSATPSGRRRGPLPSANGAGHGTTTPPGGRATSARWARPADLRPLLVSAPVGGRLVLGELPGRRQHLVAAETAQSIAVIGPTQSGKTTAVAVPAILGWEGPVVAASVKTDLLHDTIAWRRRRGTVWCFDPAGTTGLPASVWSPLAGSRTWAGARRIAADLTEVTRGEGTTADGEFWYATAAKLLAPLLFAAATSGRTIQDLVRWVDTQETDEVLRALEAAGVPEALQAARATWLRDERQRSAVFTTAETVLEPFAEPAPTASVAQRAGTASDIDPDHLLGGHHSLYLCAPAHDQRRLRALFVAVVKQVLDAAFARSARLGRPLDPPLLVVLDEAANIAPLRDLDGLAATCAGHGVQLVTVWQDLAQVRARYGERAATVVNNHRGRLLLSGTADPGTLDFASHLIGDEELAVPSVTHGEGGERTVTSSPVLRRLLTPDGLRRLPPGTGLLIYGSLPPVKLGLRPWFADPELASRGASSSSIGAAPPRGRLASGTVRGGPRRGQLQSRR